MQGKSEPGLIRLDERRKQRALSQLLNVEHAVDGEVLHDATFYWVATGMAASGDLFVPTGKWLNAMRGDVRADALWTCLQVERSLRNGEAGVPDGKARRAAAAGMRKLGLGRTLLGRALCDESITSAELRAAMWRFRGPHRAKTMRELWAAFGGLVALPVSWWGCEDGVHPIVGDDAERLEADPGWGEAACLAADETVLIVSMCLDVATSVASSLLLEEETTNGGVDD